jgi:hypothetical protein
MSTEDHFTHRSVDNCFEAAQGVVVRVVALGKKGQNTKLE